MVEKRIDEVLQKTGCKTYEMYLTGSGNFREAVATIKKYKGNRDKPKPNHYQYIKDYLLKFHPCVVVHGMEADDMLAIRQEGLDGTVIVSRDKDLRQVPGWHYGYQSGRQQEFKLTYYTRHGELHLSENKKKITGGGDMFLYSQALTGDPTDNIQGIKGLGPAKAYEVLHECKNEQELYNQTRKCYVESYGDEDAALDALVENMQLVFMVRKLDSCNNPVMWNNEQQEEQWRYLKLEM